LKDITTPFLTGCRYFILGDWHTDILPLQLQTTHQFLPTPTQFVASDSSALFLFSANCVNID